jgi:outer membrane protein insertion porin family
MRDLKKILLTISFYFIFFVNVSYSETINKVKVNGNERISSETVLIFGDVSIGQNFEPSDASLLIKKLYETTFFSDISVDFKDNILIINVKENPIINKIEFTGEKAKKFQDKIKELINNREKSSFVETNIKSDINFMKGFYRSLGFYFVKIETQIQTLDKNRVNLTFLIDKGEKAKISKIYFLGDKKLRDKKLRDIITSQESKFWKFISKNVYLSEQRIDLDKRLLKAYYVNKGYYEVDLTSSNVEYSEGEGFILTFSINAGKRYKFKKIFANVSESLDQNAFNELESDFTKLVGEYYSLKEVNSILEKIDDISESKELQFINHGISETLDGDGVEVKINIFEGKKLIVERITISGNSVTNDSVIRGELKIDEGDPYSALLVNKSINHIKSRNIFSNVDIQTVDGSTDDLAVLNINVEEKATGEIMAGAGIGTAGTSFTAAISENNWLGKGVKLKSGINVSTEKISGSISVSDPNYKYSGNSVSTSLEVSSTDRTSTTGYESSKTGFSLGTSYEQWKNVYFSPKITMAFEDIEASSTSTSSVKAMEGNFFNADFMYGLTFDERNRVFKPTSGYVASFFQSLPVVQDSSSLSNSLKLTGYHGFSDNIVGSLKFLGKTIHGIDDEVRLTNRLYMPGNNLRGFKTGKVGPKDGTSYVGGNYLTAINAEAELPNLLPESYKTDISVFFDAGNLWSVDYNESLDDSSSIRSSIGIGANMFTVVGPLSFTIAQALSSASSDQTERFNFRLGTSF